MFHEFERRYGDQLPVYSGDMTPYWEDGAGSSARETGINRLASDRMTQGEILWTLLKPEALPAEGYAEALKNIAMYSEHTWGAYNSISAPDLDFVKAQWKIKQAFAFDGESQTKKLLAEALATRGSAPEVANAIDVFNTASWPRTDLVTLPKTMKVAGDIVKDEGARSRHRSGWPAASSFSLRKMSRRSAGGVSPSRPAARAQPGPRRPTAQPFPMRQSCCGSTLNPARLRACARTA